MSIVHMYESGTATEACAAQIEASMGGTLRAVHISSFSDGNHTYELSFGSVAADTTNDARGVILTHIANDGKANEQILLDVKLAQGERIYLHRREVTAGTAGTCRIALQLHIDDKQSIARVRR